METKEKRIEHKIDSKKSIMEYFIYLDMVTDINWTHKLVLFEKKQEPVLLYEYVEKEDSIRIYKDKSLNDYKMFFKEHDILVKDF